MINFLYMHNRRGHLLANDGKRNQKWLPQITSAGISKY